MQNQSSPVQILAPVIPNNWCPEGSWSDIFNSFVQLYLNNSTINIPGLGQVTPQQIATINQNIQNLQNEYNALAVNVRTGTVNLTGASVIYPISFSSAMPNASYQIIIEPISASESTPTNNWSWAVVTGSKATNGMSILFNNQTSGSITGFNWTVQSIASS